MFAISGARCANCKGSIIQERESGNKFLIGEVCHIRGKGKKALRHDPDYPSSKLNDQVNLIVLCSNCHTEIDKNEIDYTVEVLLEKKEKHEQDVLDRELMEPVPTTEIEFDVRSVVALREPPKTLTVVRDGIPHVLDRWSIIDDHMESELFISELKGRSESRFTSICKEWRASYDHVLYRKDVYPEKIIPGSTTSFPLSVDTSIEPTESPDGFVFTLTLPKWLPSGCHLDQFLENLSVDSVHLESSQILKSGRVKLQTSPQLKIEFILEIEMGTLEPYLFFKGTGHSLQVQYHELTLLNRAKLATMEFECWPSDIERHLQLIGISHLRDTNRRRFLCTNEMVRWNYRRSILRFWIAP